MDGLELFIHCLELMIPELLVVAEESRTLSHISRAINATFISLISKRENPNTFADFQPISLCNFVYKMISKLISPRFKKTISSHFPWAIRISIAQECIHSMKIWKMKACMLKVDLVKAYDCVDWEFLRLVMHQVDTDLHIISSDGLWYLPIQQILQLSSMASRHSSFGVLGVCDKVVPYHFSFSWVWFWVCRWQGTLLLVIWCFLMTYSLEARKI